MILRNLEKQERPIANFRLGSKVRIRGSRKQTFYTIGWRRNVFEGHHWPP